MEAPDDGSIDRAASEFDADLIALRQDIHRWPELAGDERRTAGLVAERLRAVGLSVSTGVGGHGVVAVLKGAGDGPTIAYRADMDAVPAAQQVGFETAAHLCGHDLHTAVGVGIAQVLSRLRDKLRGQILFIFQPAEETLAGARAMIEAGVLDHLPPREIYAVHCGPLPVGAIVVMPGVGLCGVDVAEIKVSGPDAAERGARLLAAVAGLSTVVYPPTPEEFARLVTDLQTPDGPLARSVTVQSWLAPDGGNVRGWLQLRAWPDDRYHELRGKVRELVESFGNASVEFPRLPFPAMVCDPDLSRAAAEYLQVAPGVAEVRVLHASFPFNSEDFALFLHRVPGAMFFLGVANPEAGISAIPHTPDFAVDERAIGLGVRVMAGLLASRLHTG